jgi:hypothetical protein
MATQDARLTALQIVWDHWMKDDIIARRKEFHANRIARISRWLGGRLRLENLMIYIDMYDAGIEIINDIYIETLIMTVGWNIENDKIPYGTCPECKCNPFLLECDFDDNTLILTCRASSCGYYEELFVSGM